MAIQLLALSGSDRRDSHNQHLINHMAEGARAAGAAVTVVDWRQYALPLFSEDLEHHQLPDCVPAFHQLMQQAQGFLVATPEYNGGYTPLLKNAIDWASRAIPGAAMGSVYRNKPVVIAGATVGRWGCVRSIRQLREVFGYLGGIVLPDTLSISESNKAFSAEGQLLEAKTLAAAQTLGARLHRITQALNV